jgi:hypothetical protein
MITEFQELLRKSRKADAGCSTSGWIDASKKFRSVEFTTSSARIFNAGVNYHFNTPNLAEYGVL